MILYYQYKYITHSFVVDEIQDFLGYKSYSQLLDSLTKQGIKAYTITSNVNASYPYKTNNFIEIIYVYGCGGRYMIVRDVSINEIIENIKNNVFYNYSKDDTWIKERNWALIKKYKLNKKSTIQKINRISNMIIKNETFSTKFL